LDHILYLGKDARWGLLITIIDTREVAHGFPFVLKLATLNGVMTAILLHYFTEFGFR